MLRALDLFCGEGGATKGLQRAGFHVTGMDINPQRRYCGDVFIQGDALSSDLSAYDFVWASPVCKRFTALNNRFKHKYAKPPEEHPDQIGPVRERLQVSGIPYVIENVVGAPLINPVMLCGTMFGLSLDKLRHLRRHRLFEASFPITPLACSHVGRGRAVGVSGHGAKNWEGGGIMLAADEARQIMDVPWMTRDGAAQAIPPVYAEYIAAQFLKWRADVNAA